MLCIRKSAVCSNLHAENVFTMYWSKQALQPCVFLQSSLALWRHSCGELALFSVTSSAGQTHVARLLGRQSSKLKCIQRVNGLLNNLTVTDYGKKRNENHVYLLSGTEEIHYSKE